ncbi:bifunctional diaminohydroxyphosphoribosylaminopyrimidine deaminase/5-amino-6-(5-phosphoribosylamino)uracil reductase RibD [Maritalea sp.]|uniref:bifunctional diaminohydroxyphosphoribosylaminopyrimidine deaminase/5-amino-6-(5-phosphoribosylamino)uracil reductase RibD n=1 Tax=Maritalea sp. TaxID=2003361 RepID=UPI003EF20013
MKHAIALAQETVGRTAPNPPVAAIALDVNGKILAEAVHEEAGLPHAEAALLAKCRQQASLAQVHTIVCTLEPCSHHGRTPPCSDALIEAGIKQVVYGSSDPNKIATGGHQRMQTAGIQVVSGVEKADCDELLAPFAKYVITGLPFVVVKRAWRLDGFGKETMLPPADAKTFTDISSLTFAHELRRSCDGILTGSGTVLADDPTFTVRHVSDHGKFANASSKRHLVVFDRRNRISEVWKCKTQQQFHLHLSQQTHETPNTALQKLASLGCIKILVEAGPALSQSVLESELWDVCVDIHQSNAGDRIDIKRKSIIN